MGRLRSDAPDRLVGATARLIRERGVHATGLKDIAAAAEVPMGSLYFHFPEGKSQLIVAALQASGELVGAVVGDFFTRAADARQAVNGFIDFMATTLEQTGFKDGCPLATAGLELGADHDDAAAAIDQAFSSWAAIIERQLQAEGLPDPAARSMLVVSALEGALLLSRVRRSVQPLRDVAAVLDELLWKSGKASTPESS